MAKMIDFEAFDRKFDAEESVIDYLDLATAHRPDLASKEMNSHTTKLDSEL